MSTWLFLRCESHDPPLENDGESTTQTAQYKRRKPRD